jgi:hypothetical protein
MEKSFFYLRLVWLVFFLVFALDLVSGSWFFVFSFYLETFVPQFASALVILVFQLFIFSVSKSEPSSLRFGFMVTVFVLYRWIFFS